MTPSTPWSEGRVVKREWNRSGNNLMQRGEPYGAPIHICNGANAGNCTEACVVNTHRVRIPHKRAAEGDPDYPAQEAQDAANLKSYDAI